MRLTAGRLAAAVLMAALAGDAAARPGDASGPDSPFERSVSSVFEGNSEPVRFRLDAALEPRAAIRIQDAAGAEAQEDTPGRKLRWIWIGAASAAAVAGSAINSFGEEPSYPFHVTDEGWFGRNTYAGGADKTSHFTSYYAVTRMLNEANRAFGAGRDQAALVAAGASFLAGTITELGDGTNKYGFSWSDIAMDALGAASGFAVLHFQLEDLVGFRAGLVPAPRARVFGLGKDFSTEIYTGDLKIAGLGRRLHFSPGPARFLLLSATYGAKGYPYAPPEVRQRQVGIELGVNFGEVFSALGVPRHRWWGIILYTLFDIVRIPYTAWGFRYDLNGKRWYGPDTGDRFPGGHLQSRGVRR